MNKTRIAARIIAGAVASAVLLTGALAAPAQAKDSAGSTAAARSSMLKDTGWNPI